MSTARYTAKDVNAAVAAALKKLDRGNTKESLSERIKTMRSANPSVTTDGVVQYDEIVKVDRCDPQLYELCDPVARAKVDKICPPPELGANPVRAEVRKHADGSLKEFAFCYAKGVISEFDKAAEAEEGTDIERLRKLPTSVLSKLATQAMIRMNTALKKSDFSCADVTLGAEGDGKDNKAALQAMCGSLPHCTYDAKKPNACSSLPGLLGDSVSTSETVNFDSLIKGFSGVSVDETVGTAESCCS